MDNKVFFCCINVIYNKSYKESATIQYLLHSEMYLNHSLDIFIVDNSTSDFGNKVLSTFRHIRYIDMKGNKGLSKAYNKALSEIKKCHHLDEVMIIIMDDDSLFPDDYFQTLMASIDSAHDVYLPIVTKEEGSLISPCRIDRGLIKEISDISEVNATNISAVNTGMAINGTVYKDFCYNEQLFLEYVDHDFMRFVRKKHLKTKIIDSRIKQHFSISSDNYETSMNRFKIFKKDTRSYYRKERYGFFLASYWIMIRKYMLFQKFKRISILFA